MKNSIFIHAANFNLDKYGRPCLGKCQQILDRIKKFILVSEIYKDVSQIYIHYIGEKDGIKFDVPNTTIIYEGNNLQMFEFVTLRSLRNYCKSNPSDNVLYLHTQGVSEGFHHIDGPLIDLRINQRRDYLLYWNIAKYKDALQLLKTHETCGCMFVPLNHVVEQLPDGTPSIISLKNPPHFHYTQNFWWAKAKYINKLPDPCGFPLVLDFRHQATFWLCSSIPFDRKNHACIHSLYDTWCYATNFSPERYMHSEDIQKYIQ